MSTPAPNYHRVFYYSFERCIKNSEFLEEVDEMILATSQPLSRFFAPFDRETRLKALYSVLDHMIRSDFSLKAQDRVLALRTIMLKQGIKMHPDRRTELVRLLQDIAQRFDPVWTVGIDNAWTQQFQVGVDILYTGASQGFTRKTETASLKDENASSFVKSLKEDTKNPRFIEETTN